VYAERLSPAHSLGRFLLDAAGTRSLAPFINSLQTRLRAGVGRVNTISLQTGQIRTADEFTYPTGRPAQLADPTFVPGKSHGFPEFQKTCEAVLMGRTTFEPALTADRWPWPNLDVFVLGSHRPSGTPDHVVSDSDPARLLERLRNANQGGDVHLVGGPRTIETFRVLGALDKLGLIVLPLLLGTGMRLTRRAIPTPG
jgi:dihydrofolate reductase